jgi:Leucine-rich repeat (LRR) protein
MNTLLAVISHLPYLDSLNALSCDNLSGLPLDISRVIKAGCHSNLKRLDLSMSSNLSDEALREILKLCHNLQTLDISGCRYISSAVVEQLSTLVPHVWELKIAKNDRISEDGFQSLAKLRNLISLNMSLCHNVTDGTYLPMLNRKFSNRNRFGTIPAIEHSSIDHHPPYGLQRYR